MKKLQLKSLASKKPQNLYITNQVRKTCTVFILDLNKDINETYENGLICACASGMMALLVHGCGYALGKVPNSVCESPVTYLTASSILASAAGYGAYRLYRWHERNSIRNSLTLKSVIRMRNSIHAIYDIPYKDKKPVYLDTKGFQYQQRLSIEDIKKDLDWLTEKTVRYTETTKHLQNYRPHVLWAMYRAMESVEGFSLTDYPTFATMLHKWASGRSTASGVGSEERS